MLYLINISNYKEEKKNMFNLAFYCDMTGIQNSNVSSILSGNPGIGGTQYLFLLITTLLNDRYKKTSNNVSLYIKGHFSKYDSNTPIIEVDSFAHCLSLLKQVNKRYKGNTIIVIRECEVLNSLGIIKKNNYNFVVWAHNTITIRLQRIISKTPNINKIVCVSESQYKNMSFLPFYHDKCTFINNCYPRNYFYDKQTSWDEHSAIYIGAAVPQKGMHNLLKIWKHVSSKDEKAKLYIVGGVKLRNRNSKAGNWGITSKSYEYILHLFLKRLNRKQVEFLGVLSSDELKKYMQHVKVGIVNPSKVMRDETFCMGAVELQAYGIPVVSRKRGDGLETSILNGETGFLEKKDNMISRNVIM